MVRDLEQRMRELPEPKLELVDGRLLVGNGAGNLQLLAHILEGWGAEAALPMASAVQWWQALHQGFRRFDPPEVNRQPPVWRAWANQLSYRPELKPAGPMWEGKHRRAREAMMMGLFTLAMDTGFAQVSGRDVIMRLGEDAFTPDVFVVSARHQHRLNDHYLDGPADLAIEILLPGHEAYDLELKRGRFGPGGVQEYWIVDPVKQAIQFLHWVNGAYQAGKLEPDGAYRSQAFPGLVFTPAKLWENEDDWHPRSQLFRLEGELPKVSKGFAKGGVDWGDLPFIPFPELEPGRLSFQEFAAWAPEAKFELIHGKPWIGGSRGTRHVLGLLLRTEGLARAVSVLHPRQFPS